MSGIASLLNSRSARRRGFSLVELLVIIFIVGVMFGLLLPAIQKVRAAAYQTSCMSNMRQLAIGLASYHSRLEKLPPGTISNRPESKFPWASWRTLILPDLDLDQLAQQSQKDYQTNRVPFSKDHLGLRTVVDLFSCPADPRISGTVDVRLRYGQGPVALTSYLGANGIDVRTRDGVFFLDSKVRFEDVADGLSTTLMIGERPPSADYRVAWWYAGAGFGGTGLGDAHLGVREIITRPLLVPQCPPGPYHFTADVGTSRCHQYHFWSVHSGGANFAFCDGSVHFLNYSADNILPALATRAGGETVDWP
jgi:prepilin-type processing-associated H-X9-DG protein